jgi:hypothetical protein
MLFAKRSFRELGIAFSLSSLLFAGAPQIAIAANAVAPTDVPDVVTRRLTSDQYRQAILDAFGPTVKVGGRFDPDVREGGLVAIGASRVSITATGMERYDVLARGVAAQVVDEEHRNTLISCKPADPKAADEKCAKQFLTQAGRLLYRRPLTPREVTERVGVANKAATASKNFYKGVETALATMLVSPQFLFRYQATEADPAGGLRLDPYSRASQLSFLLWNAAPDPELLAAAESGALMTKKGLTTQVDRLLASPRLEAGIRAYFTDMLELEVMGGLQKDPLIYPQYTADVPGDATEQTLRTIVDFVMYTKGDYRDLLTTRKTFLTPVLGSLYHVPVTTTDNGWQPYEFPENDPRAGLVMMTAFLAQHSHPGRSSPTLRGKAIRELLMCQRVPDPPANVDFTLLQDTHNTVLKTTRDRLIAHQSNPACAGCHKITDVIGLALESYDSIGEYRPDENGAAIDTTGQFDGVKFTDARGVVNILRNNPAFTSCLTQRVYSYGAGRPPARSESAYMTALNKSWGEAGYRVTDLLRRIATSEEFYRVGAPAAAPIKSASAQ